MDTDLAFQFSGPYAQALIAAVQQEIDVRNPDIAYLYNLAIDDANETELATIGGIIGYPWPTAPIGTFNNNNFLFGSQASFPTISGLNGFAGVDDPGVGGLLSSSTSAVGNLIPIGFYRLLLTQVAILKAEGLNLITIDKICFVFGAQYQILQPYTNTNWFTLGAFADFPNSSATKGLSGASAPYLDSQGGRLFAADPSQYPDSDIYIVFQTQIGAGYLFILQALFDRFTTAPHVFVSQGA